MGQTSPYDNFGYNPGQGGGKPAVGSTGNPGLDMMNMLSPAVDAGAAGQQYMFGNVMGQVGAMGYNTPPGMTGSTERNPQLAALQGDYAQYRGGLAAGTDQDAINAMARQRDLTSGMAKEAGDQATFRSGAGGVAAEMQGRAYSRGQQDLGALNSNLTADARRLQLQALQGQTGAATAEASANLGQQQHGLNQWQAYQNAAQSAAQMQMQAQQNQTSNMMQMLQMLGKGGAAPAPTAYTGYGSGGVGGSHGLKAGLGKHY